MSALMLELSLIPYRLISLAFRLGLVSESRACRMCDRLYPPIL